MAVLPESASIVFGGGFIRSPTLPGRKAAQRAIFRVQRELERLVLDERTASVILCDRGTLDGLAYWPEAEESYWCENGTDRASELARYAAVIHLRTPALAQGYNNTSNPVRIESAEQAAAIDERTARAWAGHPNRRFIESADDFLGKAAQAISWIRGELPECCRGHPVPEVESGI